MADIEKIITDNIWKQFNTLRRYLDYTTAKKIFTEIFFLKLLNDQLKNKNKYFCRIVNGKIKLDTNYQTIEQFYENLSVFIEANEFLKNFKFEIFVLKEKVDNKLMLEIINSIDSIYTSMEKKPSWSFMLFINIMLRNGKGEVMTSPGINKLISRLLKNKNMEELYDPTIGTGMLAVDTAAGHEDVRIYGQDIDGEMLDICRMLLILDERIEDVSNLEEGNTIVNPGHIEGDTIKTFDVVVSNPPFGVKEWGYNEIAENGDNYNRFRRGLPSKMLADYAFISHVIESMNDKGIAVMVENTGVLFKEGAEGAIREKIVKGNIIDAVIALPNNMMYGTAIQVNIIIFNNDKKTNDILFIDTSTEVQASKVLTCFTDKNIDDITKTYNERNEIGGFSRRVSMDEIAENGFNLNVQRYIEAKDEKEELDIDAIGREINMLIVKLRGTRENIEKILKKENY